MESKGKLIIFLSNYDTSVQKGLHHRKFPPVGKQRSHIGAQQSAAMIRQNIYLRFFRQYIFCGKMTRACKDTICKS